MSIKLIAAHSLLFVITLAAPAFSQTPDPADSLFGITNKLDVRFEFTFEEWKKLQPPEDVNWDIGRAFEGLIKDAEAGRNFHSDKSSRPGLAGYMGVDHQYGMADVIIGDETIRGVGVRYKGNGTFFAGHESGKYSFKIDFNEYDDDLEFRGLTKVNLNNNVIDPSMLREALSYELFREAGVPAPRTGFARVTLIVRGNDAPEDLGLYLVVEQVDKRFLKRVYGSSKGLLAKPSTFGAFRYFDEDWEKYEAAYFPKTDPTPEQQLRLIDFARLIHKSDDEEFAGVIDDYLDMDEFLSFLAVNVILSNLDSFLGGSQNYYAYLEPTSNRFQLIPWDLDISFGAFGLLGTPDSRRDLSIDRPQIGTGNNRLIERIFAIPKYRQAYRDRIEQLLESSFAEQKMIARIDEAAEFLRPLLAEEGDGSVEKMEASIAESPGPESPHALKYFVRKRRESVQNQLAGRSDGQHHSWEGNFALQFGQWIKFGAVILLAVMLNSTAWLWAVIAGFRDSTRWGLLNMFFYPITPMIYGFHKRKDFGRGAAVMTMFSVAVLVAAVAAISSLA